MLAKLVLEQVPVAAIQVDRADDIVSRLGKVLHRIGRRRLAGGHGERRRPALDGGDPLLQNIRRRIHDARVDIAKLRQAEQVRRMLGRAELVGRRLVDRHGDGAGGWVDAIACMKGQFRRILGCGISIIEIRLFRFLFSAFGDMPWRTS